MFCRTLGIIKPLGISMHFLSNNSLCILRPKTKTCPSSSISLEPLVLLNHLASLLHFLSNISLFILCPKQIKIVNIHPGVSQCTPTWEVTEHGLKIHITTTLPKNCWIRYLSNKKLLQSFNAVIYQMSLTLEFFLLQIAQTYMYSHLCTNIMSDQQNKCQII